MDTQDTHMQRRNFLQMLAAGIPQTSIGLGSLAAMGSLSAQTASDAKFMICLYMQGGNDQSNLIIPTSAAEYTDYRNARPLIGLNAASTLSLAPDNFSGPALGLHPNLSYVAQLFNEGKAAVVANVGNLVTPISLAQWNNGKPLVPVPAQIFSHNDQDNQWQTGQPLVQSSSGWLGRTADLLNSTYTSSSSKVPMNLSIGANNVMLTGEKTVAYKLTPVGSPRLQGLDGIGWSSVAGSALRRMYQGNRSNLLESHLNTVFQRGIAAESFVTSALAANPLANTFPSTGLAQQLYGVARMMLASNTLGHRRQVFFVQLGGFDFHDDLISRQAAKMAELNSALQAFCTFLQANNLWSKSVLFTTSEFGRALQSNGRGADHGWGSHHFVIGGAVRGKKIYGQWPRVGLRGPEDAGQGRLLPTTSLAQYSATLASWFGVSSSDMTTVAPYIGNFSNQNLGFLS